VDLHVVEGTGPLAVHALAVVRADDDVAERGAGLEDEDGVGVAALGLVVAGRGAAVPLVHGPVEGGARGDGLDGCQGGGAGGFREGGLQVGVGRCC